MNLLFHELLQTTRAFTNGINIVLKEHNLYSSQWTVLFTIEKHGTMTLTSIWKYLNVEAPTITRTVTRLEELGLIQREDGLDRRAKNVTLSEAGIKKLEAVKASVSLYEDEFAKGLTEDEELLFRALLKKLKK